MKTIILFTAVALMTGCHNAESDPTSLDDEAGSESTEGPGGEDGTEDPESTFDEDVAGPGCPDLSGVFLCPARDGEPAFKLIVTQEFDGQATTRYLFQRSSDRMATAVPASKSGVSFDGARHRCLTYDRTAALGHYPNGLPDEATFDFINAAGDYQTDFNRGRPMVCARAE